MRIRIALMCCALLAATAMAQQTGSWRSVGWGGGGFYWSCAFDPSADGVLYMGGDTLGIYKSTDHGQNWTIADSGLAGNEVLTIAVDPSQPKVVYAATSGGICRSDDGAAHWQTLPETGPGKLNLVPQKDKSVHALAVDPADSRRLYFAAPDGRIARSDDAGQTWRIVHTVKGGSIASVAVLRGTRQMLAATSEGILMFAERGGEPQQVLKGRAMSFAVAKDEKTIYAAMNAGGVYRSTDGGNTWHAISVPLADGWQVIDIVVSQADPNQVHCIAVQGWGGMAYRSTDGGVTWAQVGQIRGDAHNDPTDVELVASGPVNLSAPRNLAINPRNDQELFIAGNWRPVHSNDGGRSWIERSKGADISCITDICFAFGKTYVTVMDEGLLARDDAGGNWKQIAPLRWSRDQSGHQWRVRVWDNGKQILTTSSPWDAPFNQALRSLDGGATMIVVREGLSNPIPTANTMWERGYARALSAEALNPYTVYMGIDGDPDDKGPGGGIYKSTDGGWHWEQMPNQPESRRMFYGLAVDPTNPKRIFWGTCGNKGGLYRSEDAGESWKRVFENETWVFNVLVTADGTVYCPGKELWRSRDHGTTWEQLTQRNDGIDIVGLETDSADRIWYSTVSWSVTEVGGVYESRDAGKTWAEITGDLPNHQPLVLRYNRDTRQLWAGGAGLFVLAR